MIARAVILLCAVALVAGTPALASFASCDARHKRLKTLKDATVAPAPPPAVPEPAEDNS